MSCVSRRPLWLTLAVGLVPTKAALTPPPHVSEEKEIQPKAHGSREEEGEITHQSPWAKLNWPEEKYFITNQIRVRQWEINPNFKTSSSPPLPSSQAQLHSLFSPPPYSQVNGKWGLVSPSYAVSAAHSSSGRGLLTHFNCSSMRSSRGSRWISVISAPPLPFQGLQGHSCLTIVFSTGCKGISALPPGALLPPPSSLTLMSAELVLSLLSLAKVAQ